jgi:hypothetical protein
MTYTYMVIQIYIGHIYQCTMYKCVSFTVGTKTKEMQITFDTFESIFSNLCDVNEVVDVDNKSHFIVYNIYVVVV